MDEILREEAFDSENAQLLLAAFGVEIAGLYPGWTPATGPSASSVDFEPPGGRFVVAYVGPRPVACAGLRRLDQRTAEIKRLYVRPEVRGRGLGRRMLQELERVAKAQGYEVVRLDTGAEQPGALRLFAATGYRQIGDYNGNPFASHWFEKWLA